MKPKEMEVCWKCPVIEASGIKARMPTILRSEPGTVPNPERHINPNQASKASPGPANVLKEGRVIIHVNVVLMVGESSFEDPTLLSMPPHLFIHFHHN